MGMGRELARSVYWELSTALLVKYADIVRFPVSLKNRLAYLKNALREVKALHPVEESGRTLIKRFNDLEVRRCERSRPAMADLAFDAPTFSGNLGAGRASLG